MFYFRSGKYNDNEERVLVWVCDADDTITICFGDFDSYDNQYADTLNDEKITSLDEIQAYISSMDCTWDEDVWDIYDENLHYFSSCETISSL